MLPRTRGRLHPGDDIMGPFEKATTREYKYILATTNYFFEWAKITVV